MAGSAPRNKTDRAQALQMTAQSKYTEMLPGMEAFPKPHDDETENNSNYNSLKKLEDSILNEFGGNLNKQQQDADQIEDETTTTDVLQEYYEQ